MQYDQLALIQNNNNYILATDNQGRYYQNMGSWDVNKTYSGMENSKITNNRYNKYWIIDNTGNVDFQLEF
ncbi:MAG: hypothetical protein IKP65_04925 [Alphaproteobacteria bacterium]|nr:hypothetical protein [Alphaproteobacteria bacterium]